jgi:hypothetical protein
MANVNIQLGHKDSAWFTANPTKILLDGQIVYLAQTGTYKIGDGITQLSVLSFLGGSAQVNSDWNATSGVAEILNKPAIPTITGLATVTYVDTQDALKVDKVIGKGLSTNDYTSVEQTKLAGIQAGAEINVNADWNAISGDAQILNKPSIPLTTKGDLFTYNTANARLPIGLDTQVLIADSTTSTGLKWGTNTAATPTGYYGAWQDGFTQTAAASNTGYAMIFRNVDLSNGVSVVTNGTNLTRITFANTGIYNLQFSSQFQNTDNAQHDITVWLRLNGTDVNGSSGFISIPARKSAGVGNEGHIIAGWNYVLSVVAGEYYELVWSTSNFTNVTMQFYAAGSPPPSAASVIMTVTQQSGIMAGTGITAINSLTGAAQTLTTGTTGTDFAIVDSGVDHKFNLPTASATNTGKLSNTDWTTFNDKQATLVSGTNIKTVNSTTLLGSGNISVGTVTSVAALTLGTTGTDVSSTVATGTTTPVITFNLPTASATNRGALSSTDWSTFNGKQAALGYTPVTNARTLTINGTTYDLTADRSWTISTASNLAIKEEGTTLTSAATSIDFTGAGITASVVGTAVTVNVSGIGASTNLFNYYNFI